MKDQIEVTKQYVQSLLLNERTGHDWYHIERVTKLAHYIAEREGANLFIVKMAALLHDLADDKVAADEESGLKQVVDWLKSQEIPFEDQQKILSIITTISFKGGNGSPVESLEAKVVQDADRLDALGAIGIARTFVYAGAKGDPMYDPTIDVRDKMTKEEYRHGKSSAIHHFYEKLLKLRGLMNTKTGKQLANERHEQLKQFLKTFFQEWDVKF
ncbi:HD domain-containing protein [Geomicrobium sp. JCM 19055]|uniref:HD domain-containing protein n=1 Tax=Geomicrobium sp. JCM 19055 TaxID=1460649 RepID=UPI00045ED0D6|nr:HD domain-containing protein [Geomicrobium sp. JCM 19055]GAJ99275.1 HD domain protein [Geomicrobium sp. JCM 19055]